MSSVDATKRYLDLAARVAYRGWGMVEPNPLVGAVVERDGVVLGVGHHRRFGGPHAEVDALASVRRQGHDPRGATMYVTLEPCNAHGRNAPCVDAILGAGIARVVYAATDPSEKKGGGAARLARSGVEVVQSDASEWATGASLPFRTRMATGLPWVIAKWAQTVDGRVATRTGESKWISGPRARERVHALRGRVDAVLTGIGTVIADDPRLTPRGPSRPRRTPMRVVADTDLDVPLSASILRAPPATIVACDVDLARAELTAAKRAAITALGAEVMGIVPGPGGRGVHLPSLLRGLSRRGVATVMVEAGPGLLGSLFDADLVDEAVVYVAPLLLGDEEAASAAVGRVATSLLQARRFELRRVTRVDHDVELVYRRAGPARHAFG